MMRLLLFCQLFFVGIQASKLGVSPPSQRDQVNCQLYTVQPNDSCIGIISNNNITYAQLLSWNPSLNPTCSYAWLYSTTWRCANAARSVTSQAWIRVAFVSVTLKERFPSPVIQMGQPLLLLQLRESFQELLVVNCATSEISTDVFDSPIPSPTLDQTTSRCAKYYQVVDGDDCSHLTAQFAITLKDLYTIHPRTLDWSFSFYANLEELTLPSSY